MGKVLGIVGEYNPFHNGHLYHLEQSKKMTSSNYTVAIMGGNFTQRGSTSLIDKWSKAEAAIQNGIDLVIELPVLYTTSSAENFADGAIKILDSLKVVDYISFGAETSDVDILNKFADVLYHEPRKYKILLSHELSKGISYPKARENALMIYLNDIRKCVNVLSSPNNILGIEYLKANLTLEKPLTVNIIQRMKAEHNDLNYQENFASGTAIRHSLYTNNSNFSKLKQVVPDETYFLLQEIHQTQDLPHLDYLFTNLISKLRLAKLDELTKIYGIREGLEYKLLKTANEAINLQDFFQKLKSKRYPLTNLQRLTLYLLLNITKDLIQRFDDTGALYARVLAFNDKGTELLKQMKKNASIPIITKTTSYLDSKKRCQQKLTTFEEMLAIDTYATELYNLCFNPFKPYGRDFTTSPYYFKTNNEN